MALFTKHAQPAPQVPSRETELNAKITDAEQRIRELCMQLGKSYYELHKDEPEPQMEDFVTQMKNTILNISQWREELLILHGNIKCPQCGSFMPAQAAHCNACGCRLIPEEPAAPAVAAQPAAPTCPSCGYVGTAQQRFCIKCGTALQQPEPSVPPKQEPQRFCGKCGSALVPGGMFCIGCGKPIV